MAAPAPFGRCCRPASPVSGAKPSTSCCAAREGHGRCFPSSRFGKEPVVVRQSTFSAFPVPAVVELGKYYSAAAVCSGQFSRSCSTAGGGDGRFFAPFRLGNEPVVVPQFNLCRSAPGSQRLCLCECSGSDDAPASSSATPPAAAPPSPAFESAEGEGNGEIRTEQRPRSPRREADSTDWISSSLTRRFGLAGGLAWVGFLAFGVVSEQIKTRTEVFLESQGTQDVEGAKEVVLDNNVKYVELRTGGGSSPFKGDLVLVDVTGRLRSTGQVFMDTTSGTQRSLAFVYGLKPYPRGVCYGLEYALQSMKAGGKRKVTVPADQCFGDAGESLENGVVVPGGSDIEYEVQLQKVSIAPS